MRSTDPHFSPAALRFMRALKRNNDRVWFGERKPVFEGELKAPMLAIIGAVNERMSAFAPEHVRPPEKTMLRIYRDIRFSNDKRPYKHHLSAWWGRSGFRKTSGAGFYLQWSPMGLLLAAGVYMPEREHLLMLRRHLTEHPAQFDVLASRKALRGLLERDEGQPLTRTPKGFDPEHPADALVRCRHWGASVTLPGETGLEPGLVAEVIRRFRVVSPLVHFLNEPFAPAARRALF